MISWLDGIRWNAGVWRSRDRIEPFEHRGIVEVKGKGLIETWFVVGRLPGRPADASNRPESSSPS
jgi:hypothetical protein